MFRGPLHDRGPDGRCTECGEPFVWTGIAIYESIVADQDDAPYTYSPPDWTRRSGPLERRKFADLKAIRHFRFHVLATGPG
jgi:hypothetical protein